MPVNTDFINSLKRGRQLTLMAINYDNGQTLSFPMTLTGFTAAYDGDPTDVNAAAAQLTSDRSQADAARQRLICLQNPAATGCTAQ
jgi:hypothetical protein